MYLRVYKRRKSAIAVTLKINANRSAHTLLQDSVAKVKLVHDKSWLGNLKLRKKFPGTHRSVGMFNSRNGRSVTL